MDYPFKISKKIPKSNIETPVKRALIIEDNTSGRDFHIKLFEALGCKVDIVENEEHLIAKLDMSHVYTFILIDMDLLNTSAIEIATKIRQCEYGNHRAHIIVLVTDNISEKILMECSAAGINNVVKKPPSSTYFPEIVGHA